MATRRGSGSNGQGGGRSNAGSGGSASTSRGGGTRSGTAPVQIDKNKV